MGAAGNESSHGEVSDVQRNGDGAVDYAARELATLTFAAGETSKTITVNVKGDTTIEPDETFFVNLSSPTNAVITDGQGVGTIKNDDPDLKINNIKVIEGNAGTSVATFTVSLTSASSSDVSVDYATADGTATAGSDYVPTSGTITIPAGSTSATVQVPIIGDTAVKPTRRSLSTSPTRSTGRIIAGQGQATIVNDDNTISVSDVTLAEGNSGTTAFNFIVSLSAAASFPITVNYATANGTATAGSDYTAIPITALVFAAGETSQTVTVVVNGDTLIEPDETFFVRLSSPTNATIAKGSGTGKILDDDLGISINDVSLPEGNSGTTPFNFTVSLSAAASFPVTVKYATADGTATAPSDYTALA